MEFNNTLVVLNAHTDEIKRLLEGLENSDEIRVIDLDLILEKLRVVYDVVNDLKREAYINKEPKGQAVVSSGRKKAEGTVDTTHRSKESLIRENKDDLNDTVSAGKEEIHPGSKKEQKADDKKETVLSDRFRTGKPTLNEEIGSQSKQEDLTSQFSTNPIASLTAAIGLNEKFELINELFEGDKNKFDRTMQVLNSSDSFVEAYGYLEENFEWDMENPYVQRILELIRRKLIVRRNEQ